MESKNERIKKIFPKIIGIADELFTIYMPTDENGYGDLDNTTLFGHSMQCFSFSTARLCYIAVSGSCSWPLSSCLSGTD